jgi:uncharacterized protein YsxB (DUF464 family)
MELNQKVIESVAGLLKIEASNLAEALTNAEKVVELPEKVYLQPDVDVLVENVQKEKYENGKIAGVEMTLKDLKKKYGEEVDLEGTKDFDTLLTKLIGYNTEKLQIEIADLKDKEGQEVNTQVENLEMKLEKEKQKIEALQSQIKEKELTFENSKLEMKKAFNQEKANNSLLQNFSGLQFTIPKHIEALGDDEVEKYNKTQKLNAINLFKSRYSVDYDDEGNEIVIDKMNNEALKDDLQNYQKLSALIMPFAKNNYLNIHTEETPKGRKPGSGRKTSFIGMSKEALYAYAKENGIRENSNEFDVLYKEFKDANK